MKKDPYAPYRETPEQPPSRWRSLEHLRLDPAVKATLDPELPNGLPTPGDVNRREVLKLAGASLALSGLTGCNVLRRPEEEILPYTKMPEQVIPGLRMQYATSHGRSEGAVGLLVEAHEGRPTKVEGNPGHPASLGGADIWAQAEVLKLYDPDRARTPLAAGKPSTWPDWDTFANDHFGKLVAAQGKGLALLCEEGHGPTFERLLKGLAAKMPQAKLHRFDPLGADHALMGAQLAFGAGARVHYDLTKASVIFALDSDFLVRGPDHLRLAREFGAKRAVASRSDTSAMNRLYAAEGVFSSTGANADHRARIASGEGIEVLKAVAHAAKADLGAGEGTPPPGTEKFVETVGRDLAAHAGAAVVLVGERQPAAVHALAYALNAALGALGSGAMKVSKGEPVERVGSAESLAALEKSLTAGEVQTLVVFGGNPAFTAPASFATAMAKATHLIHLGVLPEETGARASWHLPTAHFLESWGDTRSWDGTVGLVQPLILPLFGARSELSLLAQLAQESERVDRALVEATWRAADLPLHDNKAWRRALHDGVVPDTAFAFGPAEVQKDPVAQAAKATAAVHPSKDALEVVLTHGHVLDGRLANVSWLQELPDSMNKLCWDNALIVSPALAKELGIESKLVKNGFNSEVVELTAGGRTLTAPTFVLPGLAKYTVSINAGYGKTAGEVAKGVGVAAGGFFTAGTVAQGATLKRTGATVQLCSTQDHFAMPADPFHPETFAEMSGETDKKMRHLGNAERLLAANAAASEYGKEGGKFVHEEDVPKGQLEPSAGATRPVQPIQLTQDIVYQGQQWGMVIDLSSCIGCSACMVACVSENNIPVVGREQVLLGRELHWIRVDRYFEGDIDSPKALHQPLNCQMCENAPCEPVCPVGATVHDDEGLNAMAYNRCIGTRYCNNNCPYKVRRFNYLDFTNTGVIQRDEHLAERNKVLQYQHNPDVTVRYRGVMEKCSYCTQRIEEAKYAYKRQGGDWKALPDGAVTPACAQTCPTQAITFGNINDPKSKVAKLKVSDRNYELLQELNTRPRTTYLGRILNENEELG